MALTAGTLIDDALKSTIGQQGPAKIPLPMLFVELTMQDQLLTQMAAQIAPDLLATVSGSVTLTDAGNTNGYTLANGILYRDFTHIDSADDRYTPCRVVRRADRDRLPEPPALMIRTGTAAAVIYPVDPLGKRWAGSDTRTWFEPDEGHTLSYSYVAMPTPITSRSSTLKSPQMAREIIIASLELKILLSRPGPKDQLAIEAALAKRQGLMDSYRMQLYKFAAPQGLAGRNSISESDVEWVYNNVGG